jgi:hypothetical protein
MTQAELDKKVSLHNRISAFRRKRLYPLWSENRWFLIGITWLVSMVLGYVGFYKYSLSTSESSTVLDLIYRSIQLMVFESGDVEGGVPWQLEIARFLMPAVAGYAAIQAILSIYRDQWQIYRIRYLKNHLILCGLGERGLKIAQDFFEQGYRLIIIEADEENPMLRQVRELEAAVLIGDATDLNLLRKAGIKRAKYLIAVCADDGINAEIAFNACSLSHLRKKEALTVFVHIIDLELCNLLSSWGLAASKTGLFRLEFFNVMERGARIMLKEYPPFTEEDRLSEKQPHIVLVGMGKIGKSLVAQATKNWWFMNVENGRRLQMTIIDSSAELKINQLCRQYPKLEQVCDLEIFPVDYCLEMEHSDFLFANDGYPTADLIYVCIDDEAIALVSALKLYKDTEQYKIPIVVKMSREAGLATLLKEDKVAMGLEYIHSFGLLDRTCNFDALLGGIYEIIARAIHEDYIHENEQKGETCSTNASMVNWNILPEELKESNRSQAAHIEVKLASINCRLQHYTEWTNDYFIFKPEEINKLAKMEHERWCAEKTLHGWTYKPGPKNKKKKTNPLLITWEALDEEIKKTNINTIKKLPSILTRAGFQICRK